MSQVSITEAAKMAGVSRATIYNDIDSGTLSFETGPKEKKMINVSELQRVYKTLKLPDENNESKDVEKRQERQNEASNGAGGQVAVLQERLEAEKKRGDHLEELLKKEQEERKRERDTAQKFENYMTEQLTNQGKNIDNFTRLLEDQRGTKSNDDQDELKETVKALKKEIEDQKEETRIKEAARRQSIKKRQEELEKKKAQEAEAEKNKSLLKKLFG